MTGLLEEECKRRACVEQISLQRISELEAEVLTFLFYFFSFCCFSSPIESKPPIVIPLVLKLEKERCKSFDHQENRKSITTLRHVRAS